MNSGDSKNYLLIEGNGDIKKDLFEVRNYVHPKIIELKNPQVAVNHANKGEYVLYITQSDAQSWSELKDLSMDLLKLIIFLRVTSLECLIQKLLELRKWRSQPTFIILESLHVFESSYDSDDLPQKYCLLVAAFFHSVKQLEKRHGISCLTLTTIDKKYSSSMAHITENLIDFFYYKTVINDLSVILNLP